MKGCILLLLVACGGATPVTRIAPSSDPAAALIEVPGAVFELGDPRGEPDERPRMVAIEGFSIMRHEVTNDQFAAFVEATGHVTDPEGHGVGFVWPGRWTRVRGADWRHPSGPASSIEGRGDHPVVQVSWRDASAFCAHHRLRLPTDAEWELAAGGTDGRRYPWGNAAPDPTRANAGATRCCAADDADGYLTTAPVGSYPAGRSPYGLDDAAGNVWEWTASRFPGKPGKVALRGGGWGNDHYCLRVSYRHANPIDRGLDMVGFRCAR